MSLQLNITKTDPCLTTFKDASISILYFGTSWRKCDIQSKHSSVCVTFVLFQMWKKTPDFIDNCLTLICWTEASTLTLIKALRDTLTALKRNSVLTKFVFFLILEWYSKLNLKHFKRYFIFFLRGGVCVALSGRMIKYVLLSCSVCIPPPFLLSIESNPLGTSLFISARGF